MTLLVAATIAAVIYGYGAVLAVRDRPMWWRWWAGLCCVMIAFSGVSVWSYMGQEFGTRSGAEHMAMMRLIGPLGWLDGAAFILAGVAMKRAEMKDVLTRLRRGAEEEEE